MELMPSAGRTATFIRVIFGRPSHTWFAACAVCTSWHSPPAVRLHSLSARWIFYFILLLFIYLFIYLLILLWVVHTCYPPAFYFLHLLDVKGWCGPNPPGALKVGVKTLLRSQDWSREAGLHVGSCGMALWRVQGHMWGQGFLVLRLLRRQEITWPEVRGFPCTWGVGFAPPYFKKGSLGSLAWGPVGRDCQVGGSYQWDWLR